LSSTTAPAFAADWLSDGLLRRLVLLGAAFSFELLALTLWLDNAALYGRPGLNGFIGAWGAVILRAVVGFAALFLTFSWLKYKPALLAISRDAVATRISAPFLLAHLTAISLFAALSSLLYGTAPRDGISDLLALAWLASGLAAIACGAFAFLHPRFWLRILRATGYIWSVALAAVLLACVAGNSMRLLWPWASGITLHLTSILLSPFIPDLMVNPALMQIGSQRFHVEIAPECSGLEGIGLMLAFGLMWLALFRTECRFPQALLLLPTGALLIFFLNSLRIAALVLIGNAGAERIALGGFHSQAGWMIFNLVALGFTLASNQAPWITTRRGGKAVAEPSEYPAASWLIPFVTILAAGMISRALTGDFEWLYPLRSFAAAGVLVYFRRRYAALDWRIDWTAPLIGLVVFILWIGLERLTSTAPEAMPSALATATPAARDAWILLRVLAAVVTVPIAEELAFRGFLYRRLLSADFEAVSLRRFSWVALSVSSLIFGMLHGSRWFAGALAGGLYAITLLRKGRIGNAIVAHAVTNALIAADVLLFGQWQLW
jgi:exosortase E/protease (VPEID-CTERM system)